jgi:hypothetical protein
VAIPITFSAPTNATYPALKGFAVSPEDSLRYAVWLLMMADDAIRRHYSFAPDNPAAPVRITQGRPNYDPVTLTLTLPCMVVDVDVSATRFRYSTSGAGELDITVGLAHIEAADSSTLSTDVDAPSLTAEAVMCRWDQILMRGTLYDEAADTRKGKLVDPYRTPRKVDGTYDIAAAKWLNVTAPEITPARKLTFTNKRVKSQEELFALDPIKHSAVSYARRAKYTVSIGDRDEMR